MMYKSPGKPLDFIPSPKEIMRFLGKVEIISLPGTKSHGCWKWIGGMVPEHEYGRIWFRQKFHRAHRVSFQIFVGPVEHDEDVHHTCRNEWCVNPRHLEATTHSEHGAESGAHGHASMMTVNFCGGPLDGEDRRFHHNQIPETFDVRGYGRIDIYRFSEEHLEYVYDGHRRVKKRK